MAAKWLWALYQWADESPAPELFWKRKFLLMVLIFDVAVAGAIAMFATALSESRVRISHTRERQVLTSKNRLRASRKAL